MERGVMNKIQLNVGTPADLGQRFTSAWHRGEGG